MALEHLKEYRIAAGKSVADCARHMALTVHGYRRWERGEVEPKASQIVTLAGFFGVTADRLLTDRPDETESQRMVISVRPGQRVSIDVTGVNVEESPGYQPEVNLQITKAKNKNMA